VIEINWEISARRLSGSSSVPGGRVDDVVSVDVVDSPDDEVVVEPVVAAVVVEADGVHAHSTSATRATNRRRGLTGIRLPAPNIKS
jgi:hypothetical protein